MKTTFYCILLLVATTSFSQTQPKQTVPIIVLANDAYNHVGQLVAVQDSIYSGTVVNDSTAVCQIGAKTSMPRLTMIYIGKYNPVNQNTISFFQRYKIRIYGIVTGTAQAPQIVVHGGTNNLSISSWHAR